MAYSAEQKALAVAIIARCGGMTNAALSDIETALGKRISTSTLHSWLPKESKTETPKTETEKTAGALVTPVIAEAAEQALDELFETVARSYLAHANTKDVITQTKGKDAVVAAATAVDKMRLLRGLPTEIVQIMPDLIDALRQRGYDPASVFNDMIAELASADEQIAHSEDAGTTT